MPAPRQFASVQTHERPCAHCLRMFTPKRQNQRFGTGSEHPECRRWWHIQRNREGHPHLCAGCRRIHKIRKKAANPPRRHKRVCTPDCFCQQGRLL